MRLMAFVRASLSSRIRSARFSKKPKSLGLPVKLHAEQLSNLGGAQLAAEFGALSADHLEYANDDDAKAMAKSGTVAVILPGAFYTLRETQLPPIDAFRKHKVPMALATDCNPGSSPITSLLLTMNMACTLFPHDTGGSVERGNAQRRQGAWIERSRHNCKQDLAPISRSGMWKLLLNFPTASASIRFTNAFLPEQIT